MCATANPQATESVAPRSRTRCAPAGTPGHSSRFHPAMTARACLPRGARTSCRHGREHDDGRQAARPREGNPAGGGERAVGLRQDRGHAHARGPRLLLRRQPADRPDAAVRRGGRRRPPSAPRGRRGRAQPARRPQAPAGDAGAAGRARHRLPAGVPRHPRRGADQALRRHAPPASAGRWTGSRSPMRSRWSGACCGRWSRSPTT